MFVHTYIYMIYDFIYCVRSAYTILNMVCDLQYCNFTDHSSVKKQRISYKLLCYMPEWSVIKHNYATGSKI